MVSKTSQPILQSGIGHFLQHRITPADYFFTAGKSILLAVSIALLAGCVPIQPSTIGSTPATASTPEQTLVPDTTRVITQENRMEVSLPTNPIVVQAMKDLGTRLGVSLDQIMVLRSENVTWPDSGIGCPKPGMMYTQVQQDGMRIILSVAEKSYEYHSGGARGVFLCENPQ